VKRRSGYFELFSILTKAGGIPFYINFEHQIDADLAQEIEKPFVGNMVRYTTILREK